MIEKKPTVLIILDGWGIAPQSKKNAITLAKTPTLERLAEIYPSTELGATGEDVGLEKDKMSGSEAGHMNIGAGRIAYQDSYFISKSIADGSFFQNPALLGAIRNVEKNHSQFHLMGLMGSVDSPHSDPEHFRAILNLAKKSGLKEVYCHLFADGRDSFPQSAKTHLANFRKIMREEKIGKICTLSGRFYAMDRAKNWDRLMKSYEAIVFSRGKTAKSAEEAIEKNYSSGLTDEYLLPTVILDEENKSVKMKKGDSLVFFNLRSDRARQFTKLFVNYNISSPNYDEIPEVEKIKDLYFAVLTNFGPDLNVRTVWNGKTIPQTLPVALGKFNQLYLAETEKFSHITYFFNGGFPQPVNNEDRISIPSPKIDSYAKIPQMSAISITDCALENLQKNNYDFYAINFANADMVGHTGDLGATVKACEILDGQLKIIVKEILGKEGNLIITADHGNAEDMRDEKTGQPNTFHTKNSVPFFLVGEKFKGGKLFQGGILGNIAPTILDILNLEKPAEMKKESLLT